MSGFKVELKGMTELRSKLTDLSEKSTGIVRDELAAFGENTVAQAKRLCPVDEGFLRNSISASYPLTSKGMSVEIVVAANYAAYVEFGTRKFAAAHVATLPPDWQSFAAQFKGKGGGDYYDFLNRILDWVKRKGIASRYSVKTRQAVPINIGGKGKKSREDQDRLEEIAYAIALSILRKGTKAHPFLYPAVRDNKEILIDKLIERLK